MEYLVKDEQGYILIRDLQTVILNSKATVLKKIDLFPSIRECDCEIYINIYYGNKTYTKLTGFTIYNEEDKSPTGLDIISIIPVFVIIILFLIILILLILIHIERITLEKMYKQAKPVKETKEPVKAKSRKLIKNNKYRTEIIKQIGKQMRLLSIAHKFKLISEKAFKREKSRIRGYSGLRKV